MKKLTQLLELPNDDALFNHFMSTLNLKGITQWDYYVNWNKVYSNIAPYELELNILNVLIGKEEILEELTNLIVKYPKVIDVIPILLAIRFKRKSEQHIDIVTDPLKLEYLHFDLTVKSPTYPEATNIAKFFVKTGLGDLAYDRKIKNFVDYATGVEVGLDSNGRKNRGGHQMENLVEKYIFEACKNLSLQYLKEPNAAAIKSTWGIDIKVDKSSRRLDFAINNDGRLYFFEVNFYNGGGSKLKSTATEYSKMNEYWNSQGIKFVWITDGAGWLKTSLPLREYFDKAEYLLNLDMLRVGVINKILES